MDFCSQDRSKKKKADKSTEEYWKLIHSPKNEDDYMVTSDAEWMPNS